ncbi:hypothetical protein TNCV_385621 [Trichonephila clavipes]|nr:hypothetical protein TNCV_385621 [Trichonephila clavipes]
MAAHWCFNLSRPSTYPEAGITFQHGTVQAIPSIASNFEAQFPLHREAPELLMRTCTRILFCREHLSQIDTLWIFYMPYNHATWPLSFSTSFKPTDLDRDRVSE